MRIGPNKVIKIVQGGATALLFHNQWGRGVTVNNVEVTNTVRAAIVIKAMRSQPDCKQQVLCAFDRATDGESVYLPKRSPSVSLKRELSPPPEDPIAAAFDSVSENAGSILDDLDAAHADAERETIRDMVLGMSPDEIVDMLFDIACRMEIIKQDIRAQLRA